MGQQETAKEYKGRELVLTDKQIGKCRDCKETIGWLTSQRTQKMYCVNVKEDPFSDQYNCVSNDFHRCQ